MGSKLSPQIPSGGTSLHQKPWNTLCTSPVGLNLYFSTKTMSSRSLLAPECAVVNRRVALRRSVAGGS